MMNISPGIYAIHRRSEGPIEATTLFDEPTGLGLSVVPARKVDGPAVMLVLRGGVEVEGLGAFAPGEAFVAGATTDIQETSPDTQLLVVTHKGRADLNEGIAIRSSEHPEWPACDPTPASVLLTATPSQTALTLYSDASQGFASGFWSTTAYHRRSIEFPKFELMYMLSGWIELTVDGGSTHRFEEGDTFLIAKGTHCDWRTGGMSKFYCALAPVA